MCSNINLVKKAIYPFIYDFSRTRNKYIYNLYNKIIIYMGKMFTRIMVRTCEGFEQCHTLSCLGIHLKKTIITLNYA